MERTGSSLVVASSPPLFLLLSLPPSFSVCVSLGPGPGSVLRFRINVPLSGVYIENYRPTREEREEGTKVGGPSSDRSRKLWRGPRMTERETVYKSDSLKRETFGSKLERTQLESSLWGERERERFARAISVGEFRYALRLELRSNPLPNEKKSLTFTLSAFAVRVIFRLSVKTEDVSIRA